VTNGAKGASRAPRADSTLFAGVTARNRNPRLLSRDKAKVLKDFIQDETGLELSEYAVAAALVTLAVVGAVSALGGSITVKINELAGRIAG
jgi:Flp pilus assembly pilin Flp